MYLKLRSCANEVAAKYYLPKETVMYGDPIVGDRLLRVVDEVASVLKMVRPTLGKV